MRTLLLLLLIWSGLFISTTLGQISEEEVYPKQASINHNEAVKNFSKGFVSNFWGNASFQNGGLPVVGFNNSATVNIMGSENVSFLSQQGYELTGAINIEGDYNKTSLTQSGYDLQSILNIQGTYNNFDMGQYGYGLSNIVNVSGSGLHFDARHTNYGFELNQQGVGAIPLSIQQTGQTIPITIKNN